MNTVTKKIKIEKTLNLLINSPNMRPFLFRTRFERLMIKLVAYANEVDQENLKNLAMLSLNKMQSIIDKSNTTSDGTLRSYTLLKNDMMQLLFFIQN